MFLRALQKQTGNLNELPEIKLFVNIHKNKGEIC